MLTSAKFNFVPPHRSSDLTHPKYRSDIDGLRALAVILVLGFHAFPRQFGGGFVGVDIFFVISGFLISGIIFSNLEHDTFDLKEFQVRRIKRIFPALLTVLVACLAIGWVLLTASEYKSLGKQVAAAASFIPNFALWSETGYFDKAAATKPLLHLWSLGIEEQFYIFWPLLLGFVWKRKYSFAVITFCIGACSFIVNIICVDFAPAAAFYFPFSRFWELMIGGTLAFVALHRPHYLAKAPNLCSLTGIALIILSVIFLDNQQAFPGWWALAPTVGGALVISAGRTAFLNEYVLGSRAMVPIGTISYPLYLWHWPLLSFAWIIDGGEPRWGTRIALLILAFILAALTYLLIEHPIRSRVFKTGSARWLCVVMIIIGTSGGLIYFADGAKFRLINGNPAGFDFDLGASDKVYSLCFLDKDQTLPFKRFCDGDAENAVKSPLVLVWGDSHAHSITLGLREKSKLFGFSLAQYTASACPPLIDFTVEARPQCKSINEYVAQKIKTLKPNMVILSAYWYLYNGYEGYSKLDYTKLQATIRFLKDQHIPNITIVGELPSFYNDQPDIAVRVFISGKTDRTFYKFNREAAAVNDMIRAVATANTVNFVSPVELLCNDQGCLISTSKSVLIPLAWDYGHLTKSGALHLLDLAMTMKQLSLPMATQLK
jgi:peptidoglycan/LPS O-acetylase OafA/YrhL